MKREQHLGGTYLELAEILRRDKRAPFVRTGSFFLPLLAVPFAQVGVLGLFIAASLSSANAMGYPRHVTTSVLMSFYLPCAGVVAWFGVAICLAYVHERRREATAARRMVRPRRIWAGAVAIGIVSGSVTWGLVGDAVVAYGNVRFVMCAVSVTAPIILERSVYWFVRGATCGPS